jgi:hypothetical protein
VNTPRTNTNQDLLLTIVGKLGPLLDRIVFVGGCVTGLLVTDPGAGPIRATADVDVIANMASTVGFAITDEMLRLENADKKAAAPARTSADVDAVARSSYTEFIKLSEQLRKLGFRESVIESAPICRWEYEGLILDVMPTDSSVLGFTNRWYEAAFENSTQFLIGDYNIRLITAPYFLATKLEAFHSRGKNDYSASRDLEDIVTVVDGRPELLEEVSLAVPELQRYISKEFRNLLVDQSFLEALPGFLLPDDASQERDKLILQRMHDLVSNE